MECCALLLTFAYVALCERLRVSVYAYHIRKRKPGRSPLVTQMSGDTVEAELRVGTLDFALAKLISDQQHTIEFPTILLPADVVAGSIIKLTCSRAVEAEDADSGEFRRVQEAILESFGTHLPETPVLHARNTTQTSVVLEWDPIDLAAADLRQLELYRDGQRIGVIPDALQRTSTKVSNLNVDTLYGFTLVLFTSAGRFESRKLEVKTHKMSDLSGIVVVLGNLSNSNLTEREISECLKNLHCRPPQEHVNLESTHLICSNEGGPEFEHASRLNIPIVRPEWLKACEVKRELVGVREYYLAVDPSTVAPPQPAEPTEPSGSAATPVEESDHLASAAEVTQNAQSDDGGVPTGKPALVEGDADSADSRGADLGAALTLDSSDEHRRGSPFATGSEQGGDPQTQSADIVQSEARDAEIPEQPAVIPQQLETAHQEIDELNAATEEAQEEAEDAAIVAEDDLQKHIEDLDLDAEMLPASDADSALGQASQIVTAAQQASSAEANAEANAETKLPHQDASPALSGLAKILENDSKVELHDSEEQHVQISTVEPVVAHSADVTSTDKEETSSMQDVPL